MIFNPLERIFPILQQTIKGNPLVYLDNAATSQKPEAVLKAMDRYYRETNANVHRGAHTLSDQATEQFEGARETIKNFLNASSRQEIIWTRGTTEAINLVAQSYGRAQLKKDDEIIVSQLEHHSNIVPWQILAEQTGARLKVVPINANTELDLSIYKSLLNERTRIVAVNHVSNSTGTINPIKEITSLAHETGAVVVVDGAQAAPHVKVDVQEIGCDFYACSAHKAFGPTGIGALFGRLELLDTMPPYQGGGEMIERVSFSGTTYNQLPFKF